MGSSHSLNGVNPKYLSYKALNLAYPLRRLENDIKIVTKWINLVPNIKLIIMPADYITLWHNKLNKKYNTLTELHFSLEPSFYDYFNHMRLCEFNCHKYGNSDGFMARSKKFSEFKNLEKEKQISERIEDFHNSLLATTNFNKVVNKSIDEIEDFMIFCENRNIEVLFIEFPVTSQLKKNYRDSLTKYSLVDYAEKRNWNTMKFYDEEFNDSLFNDPNHLNIKGAKKATIMIDSVIINLLEKTN